MYLDEVLTEPDGIQNPPRILGMLIQDGICKLLKMRSFSSSNNISKIVILMYVVMTRYQGSVHKVEPPSFIDNSPNMAVPSFCIFSEPRAFGKTFPTISPQRNTG